jgi:hypothetical protein
MPYPVFRHNAVDHPAGEENGEHANHVQRLFTGLKSAVSGGQCGNQRALINARNKSISLSIAYLPVVGKKRARADLVPALLEILPRRR